MSSARELHLQTELGKRASELYETKQITNLVFLVCLVSACASACLWFAGNRHGLLEYETNQTITNPNQSRALSEAGVTVMNIAGGGLHALTLFVTLFILFKNNCTNSCSKFGLFGKANRGDSERTPLVEEVNVETPSL